MSGAYACQQVVTVQRAMGLWTLCQWCGQWQPYVLADTRPARGFLPGMQRPACHACALAQGMLSASTNEELFEWRTVEDRHHRYCWDCTVERFFSGVGEPEANGCRPWLKERTYEGYGRFRLWTRGAWRHPRAHRFMYELDHGNIPKKYVVDHTCEHTWCVALEHLDPVTNGENQRRYYARKRVRIALEIARAA